MPKWVEKYDYQRGPSPQYPYLVHDAADGQNYFLRTAEQQRQFADQLIAEYFSDTWAEETDWVFMATVTAIATQVDRVDRPDESALIDGHDEDGNDWGDPDIEYRCRYEMREVAL